MRGISLEELKEVLDILEESFKELNIDFYLIGAIAKEHWYRRGSKIMRQTKDVDFAILVPNIDVYYKLKERLKNHQYIDTRENAFVMISPQGVQVDLLPFGEIAIDDGVKVTGEGMTSIRVNGFMEVYQAGTATAEMQTGHFFKTATLPAIVLLKLIAFDDRPEKRQKDARDIANIIQHFFHLEADLIYEYHNDLFAEGEPDRTLEEIAAIVIGREMKKMCAENQDLQNRLAAIFATHINHGRNSGFIRQMTEATKTPVDQMRSWLAAVKEGLLGTI